MLISHPQNLVPAACIEYSYCATIILAVYYLFNTKFHYVHSC